MCNYKIGLDIGSTTVKLAVIDLKNGIHYRNYKRHYSDIRSTLFDVVQQCLIEYGDITGTFSITGSGGLSLSDLMGIPFEQEVIACTKAVQTFIPDADVIIELGGEDAKITYLNGQLEQRMNNSCAGGTGAFIDQMAVLLHTDAAGLNELAKSHSIIYPIASRCGVFAKTDIQPLINDGARKENIAASILQAVVNQTIGGLACGKPIRGKIAFLGGPLYFLTELRERFTETLHLDPEKDVLLPEDSIFYPAIGAALASTDNNNSMSLSQFIDRLSGITYLSDSDIHRLPPLFSSQEDYELFRNRHSRTYLTKSNLKEYEGKTFLGIDAGSTTTKVALIGEHGELLYDYYGNNEGEPITKIIGILKYLYEQIPKRSFIAKSTVTGYGEAFLKAALHIDIGEIETIAHYKAAAHFLPDVDFILDIGGQDMKCIRIKNGSIDNILLNEACSSGCGSFLEGFAASLNMTAEEFAEEALFAQSPVDLGTKCTVFMNSKVKQAQKEGASIADLSAGLSYSVIKNALYKVIKLRDDRNIGSSIIVQGGTFYNNAVLRAFELISGREVLRPEISGLMGAYGAALIAKERYQEGEQSNILPSEVLNGFKVNSTFRRCDRCGNRCLLTTNHFSNGEQFVSGNRCERGLDRESSKEPERLPDLYAYKYKKTFAYRSLPVEQAKRGSIGIPRTLNMFENYPFWFTLLTELGFRVELSAPSSKHLYEKGLETIPSESVCYPAKLSHGHIRNLIERGIKTIFYPSVVYETQEYEDTANHFNCPIVISYAEIIRNNISDLSDIRFLSPFLTLDNDKILSRRIAEEFRSFGVTIQEAEDSVRKARNEINRYKEDIRKQGEHVLAELRKSNQKGIVLCGKPYHTDPEINHGISSLINSFGFAVLTEDSIAHLVPLKQELRVLDQWAYNSRLYRAAACVAQEPCLELVQLNSFGCGLDSITSDQIAEILAGSGKMYTLLKIDEGANLGAAKIRIRSLRAAMEERDQTNRYHESEMSHFPDAIFTKECRKTNTILAPQLSPIHFDLIQEAARASGYQMEILPSVTQSDVEEGLKYVNNDTCYPAILMIGQIIHALKSGRYDLDHTSVIISQTGGGCRASNYLSLLKLGLKQAGFEQVPVISLNLLGLGSQPGFKLTRGFINRCIMAVLYGDLFMRVLYASRPYEKTKGSAEALYQKWNHLVKDSIHRCNKKEFHYNVKNIILEFDYLEVNEIKKPKIAIVGEILAKYHPMANNGIIEAIEDGGAEVVLPDFLDFFLYSLYNSDFKYRYLGGNRLTKEACSLGLSYLNQYRRVMVEELTKSRRFTAPMPISQLAALASTVLSLGNHTGEGWLITAEMMKCLENGVHNILCVQPLACLPNHITGRGMFKTLKEKYPEAHIMPIDYDPGISHVNQLNRIKLLLASANQESDATGNLVTMQDDVI